MCTGSGEQGEWAGWATRSLLPRPTKKATCEASSGSSARPCRSQNFRSFRRRAWFPSLRNGRRFLLIVHLDRRRGLGEARRVHARINEAPTLAEAVLPARILCIHRARPLNSPREDFLLHAVSARAMRPEAPSTRLRRQAQDNVRASRARDLAALGVSTVPSGGGNRSSLYDYDLPLTKEFSSLWEIIILSKKIILKKSARTPSSRSERFRFRSKMTGKSSPNSMPEGVVPRQPFNLILVGWPPRART